MCGPRQLFFFSVAKNAKRLDTPGSSCCQHCIQTLSLGMYAQAWHFPFLPLPVTFLGRLSWSTWSCSGNNGLYIHLVMSDRSPGWCSSVD